MVDFIIIAVIAAILCAAAWYVYKSKKAGKKCIGCPDSCACTSKCDGGCNGGCNCGSAR